MSTPFYERPAHQRFQLGSESVHMLKIVDFLRYVVERGRLGIANYLEQMGQEPFFLVAATGLGKTVAVPLHVLIRLMEQIGAQPDPQPRVWVVEPRIPIAVDQAQFMNSLWFKYLKVKREPRLPPLFGSISSKGKVNPDAPIKFVTTGIFELMAKGHELMPDRDRVIIDEAHVTVEQNAGVELGIALARKVGVSIDYMSATVDTSTLTDDLRVSIVIRADQQRYVVWKHNLVQPLRDALPQLIKATLINPDTSSAYFPQTHELRQAGEVIATATETGRSHGLLAVVNSFAGEHSDVKRLADIIRGVAPDMPVLEIAGEVVRDERRSAEFERRLRQIEGARQNYVILATSVVEMGITFPTLDFVVTMDSGYDQETIGDQTFPVVGPLGVNSLLQRVGRVGRLRPGIAYISYEVGADYADVDDSVLNRGALQYESIRFPLSAAPLMDLAYYACKHRWDDLAEWLADLELPSRLHEDADRVEYLHEQIEMLEHLGIAENRQITPLGEQMDRWIGQSDLAYAVQLQKRFNEDADLAELMFWIVATALSNTPLRTLRSQHDFFVDYTGEHASIDHELDAWRGFEHEDVAAFSMVCRTAAMAPATLFGGGGSVLDERDEIEFRRWCSLSGTDGRKLRKAGAAIADMWGLFSKINGKSPRFEVLFGTGRAPTLASLPWAQLVSELPDESVHHQLTSLAGSTTATVSQEEGGTLTWQDTTHGHTGLVHQDDTPVLMREGMYSARLVPSRETKAEAETWRLAHLGTAPAPDAARTTQSPLEPTSSTKKSWLRASPTGSTARADEVAVNCNG